MLMTESLQGPARGMILIQYLEYDLISKQPWGIPLADTN